MMSAADTTLDHVLQEYHFSAASHGPDHAVVVFPLTKPAPPVV